MAVLKSSGVKSAVSAIFANACNVEGVLIYGNGNTSSNPLTLTVYDNATTSAGTILAKAAMKASDKMGGYFLPAPAKASYGLFAKMSGTSCSYLVYYSI